MTFPQKLQSEVSNPNQINPMKTETNAITAIRLQYYSGDALTATPATQGDWDGATFTAADGSKWTADLTEEDPRIDGTGTHYLIPA